MKMKLQKYKCKNCRRITKSKSILDLHSLDCKIKIYPSTKEFLRKIQDGIYIYDNTIKEN
jgi:hypothetical protein